MDHRNPQYISYMASPEWAAFKRKMFLSHGRTPRCWCCQRKWSPRRPLDAHHLTYERFGHEDLSDVIPVCQICHAIIHGQFGHLPARQATEAAKAFRQQKTGTLPPNVIKSVNARRRKWAENRCE